MFCVTKIIRYFAIGLLVVSVLILVINNLIYSRKFMEMPEMSHESIEESIIINQLLDVFYKIQLPQHLSDRIFKSISESDDFLLTLSSIINGDPFLWALVDKENPLDSDYEPHDLVDLGSDNYRIIHAQKLRSNAAASLEEMAKAFRQEGYTLIVLSAYRSFFYQGRIYKYFVVTEGQEEADKISARPGFSQHQLGLAVDFNSLDNTLADTPEGLWLAANATRFGWSLSYPDGYEDVTGYEWESWHYRYVGKELAEFIDKYFDGIQEYALQFIQEWESRRYI